MHVKRFYQRTVRDALAAAREELGAEALVLSTELVPVPGWRGWFGQRVVALTAAAERPPALSDQRPAPSRSRHARTDGARAGVVATLTAAGAGSALAEAVAGRLSGADCRELTDAALRRALTAELVSLAAGDDRYARYEVFIGPPGVGKTTTIAKIAAQARASRGQALGLVAADAYRAGAIEHLRSYAAVIGAPFRVARNADELDQALDASRHSLLVDTAGRLPSDPGYQDLLRRLERKRDVRMHLVLAADTSAATARRMCDRYAIARPSRIVITKIDEAESAAPVLMVARECGLRVSYVTAGQRVPEDLERATPEWLAAALLHDEHQEAPTCH